MSYWLKMVGAHDFPLGNRPFAERPEIYELVRFPRDDFPPRVTPGDEMIYYAVGGLKCVFAAARLDSEVRRDVPHSEPEIFRRWPHAGSVTLQVHLEMLEFAPKLADVGAGLQERIHRGLSYFELGKPEFDRAVSLLRRAEADERLRTRPVLERQPEGAASA